MKILIVVQKPSWPSVDGGTYTTQQLVRGLVERGHEVRLIAVDWSGAAVRAPQLDLPEGVSQRTVALSRRFRWLIAVVLSVVGGRSIVWGRYDAPRLRRALAEELARERWAVVQIDGIQVARACLDVMRSHPQAPPAVYRAHNREAALLERRADRWGLLGRWAAKGEVALQHREEVRVLRMADAVAAINGEVAAAAGEARARRVAIVPAPVDQVEADVSEQTTVGFLGSLDWWPNREGLEWFLREVWPRVREKIPGAEMTIAGRSAHEWPRDERPSGTRGWVAVPESREFLLGLGVFVAPVHWTAGQQIKVLEAFSAGLAVVATPSAVAGLDHGARACRIAEHPRQFADALIELIGDPEARRQLGRRALEVASSHRRDVVARSAEDLYRELGSAA